MKEIIEDISSRNEWLLFIELHYASLSIYKESMLRFGNVHIVLHLVNQTKINVIA